MLAELAIAAAAFTAGHSVQERPIKVAGSRGISREHFEPGEEVFHQGDLGDRVYIILNGRAQVVREGAGPVAEAPSRR